MVNETKYGIISDVHRDPRIVPATIDVLKGLGAQKLLLNGDIGEHQRTLEASQAYVAVILDAVGKSGLEAHVQPGSHETVGAFQPVLDHFKSRYSNIISAFDVPKVEARDHHLVFLPGSDFTMRGEYQFGNDGKLSSGLYLPVERELLHYREIIHQILVGEKRFQGFLRYSNMDDLRSLVNEAEKTIVICHVPRRFDVLEGAVDMAYFAERADGSLFPGVVAEAMIRQQHGDVSESQMRRIAAADGLTFKVENRGNEDLRDLYAELGITKAVSGHFHESGHNAHDRLVRPVQEGTLVNELYWNTGQLDSGQTGILTVRDGKVSYQNVRLQDHLR
ncbi:hypothetical protein COV20_02935 [Candidatus Woesearchaeota archaeon CG10_big_fil_rev_8_21_14_0_10_45_16]|nr:MAG: hypothetical protein COV20_02935 [Candidatus Woesearchaeota archaeon CG10_big_fil_rev_8_21_14_0_10_45_16]